MILGCLPVYTEVRVVGFPAAAFFWPISSHVANTFPRATANSQVHGIIIKRGSTRRDTTMRNWTIGISFIFVVKQFFPSL